MFADWYAELNLFSLATFLPVSDDSLICFHDSLICFHDSWIFFHNSMICFHNSLICFRDSLICFHDSLICLHDWWICFHDSLICFHDARHTACKIAFSKNHFSTEYTIHSSCCAQVDITHWYFSMMRHTVHNFTSSKNNCAQRLECIVYSVAKLYEEMHYGVAMISRLPRNIDLFCKRAL